ncbi:hypothetical protein ETB97_000640 [Aspergillus alliaceus]|uniref:Uncharacterized protein n=1 Tax=Petromyces alliaceus TaxID=209559 RepID=A0A8H6AFC1_PETAA|nr:hypothetical protein ETB97_000640 [Aspergillus burnettii]
MANSAMGVNGSMRSIFGAIFRLFASQMFHSRSGVVYATTLLAALSVCMIPVPVCFWCNGDRIGAWSKAKTRCPAAHPASHDFPTVDKAYANAVKETHQSFGDDDLDVVALYADALVFTAVRKMFHVQTGLPISGLPVHDVKAIFDREFRHPDIDKHPGLIHFYVHYLEMSASPAVALPAAGHIQHMPTCIDVLVGDYRRSTDSNATAIQTDDKYLTKAGPKNWYSFYLLHNYHSLASTSASASGRDQSLLSPVTPGTDGLLSYTSW